MTVRRIVALGASNLTRGFETVVRVSRQRWGEDLDVLGALGHGRSYGLRSRMLVRELPSILESGLWDALAEAPPVPTRALITDVGNDILYGVEPDRILRWVDECVERLGRAAAEIVVTGLPLDSIRRLGPRRFAAFRTVLVPSCRLTLQEVASRAALVSAGLEQIAAARSADFRHLPGEWYGVDPIHVRPRLWATAWQKILLAQTDVGSSAPPISPLLWARLYAARPERRWLLGREQRGRQPALRLGGTRISFF